MKSHIGVGLSAALALILVSGCGAPDSTALLNSPMPGDETLAESADELGSSSLERWFPLDEGNEWVFEGAGGVQHVIRSEYAEDNLRVVSGLGKEPMWLGYTRTTSSNLYAWNEDLGGWSYFVRFGFRYTPWDYLPAAGPCDQFEAARAATGREIATPVGSFSDTRTIGFSPITDPTVLCAAPLIQEITFAAEVGPVQIVLGTKERLNLVSARIGSQVWAPKSELQLTVGSDEASYFNQPNTIRCITEPCPSNEVTAEAVFTLTVKNTSGVEKTYNFSSSKQFDFEILDAGGKVVRAWSDGMSFNKVLTRITLAPGETRTFSGKVELKDRHGAQLDGEYTVQGRFEAMNVSGTRTASAGFRVN